MDIIIAPNTDTRHLAKLVGKRRPPLYLGFANLPRVRVEIERLKAGLL